MRVKLNRLISKSEINRVEVIRETTGCKDTPPPKEVPLIIHEGEIYKLGRHYVMCGDSTSTYDIGKLLGGNTVDLVVTSPPYNTMGKSKPGVHIPGVKTEKLYHGGKDDTIDRKDTDNYISFILTVLNNLATVMSPLHSVVWNHGYSAESRDLYGRIIFNEKNPFHVMETIAYTKNCSIGSFHPMNMRRPFEPVFLMSLSADEYLVNTDYQSDFSNLWRMNNQNSQSYEYGHFGMFPIGLPSMAMNMLSPNSKDTIVFDPFGGLGTTLLAAERTGRTAFVMEKNEYYANATIARFNDLTNDKGDEQAWLI
jgi:DNA modification methylase